MFNLTKEIIDFGGISNNQVIDKVHNQYEKFISGMDGIYRKYLEENKS